MTQNPSPGMADGQVHRKTFAVLVDGDNAPPDVLKTVLQEVEKHGEARVRLIFGGTGALQGHKENANTYGFRPILQYNVANKKNAADIALAIAAVDLLHTKDVDAFCIVSSDSDFHPLATRLREAGRFVLGIGDEKTPDALKSACHKFVSFEILTKPAAETAQPLTGAQGKAKTPVVTVVTKEPILDIAHVQAILGQAYQNAQGEDGWALLASVGTQLGIIEPGFDSRKYGRKQLRALVQDLGTYEFQSPSSENPAAILAIRPKATVAP